jgi:hypothetical protein
MGLGFTARCWDLLVFGGFHRFEGQSREEGWCCLRVERGFEVVVLPCSEGSSFLPGIGVMGT